MEKNILAVFPHPDDETFGKAGTLAKHAKAGDHITLICATLGQMGRRMGNPFFANRETLPKLREKELVNACKVIGIDDLRLWKLQDKTLQFRDREKLADRIYDVIKEVNPSIVYSFYPNHGVHPDHDALSAATVLAISRIPEGERPVFYGSAITRERYDLLGEPDMVLDVSDVLDKKMNALRAHRSQSELITKKLDEKVRENPGETEEIMAPYMKEFFWTYSFIS